MLRQRRGRIPDDLWEAAQHRAKQRGETLTHVIRKHLQEYVK